MLGVDKEEERVYNVSTVKERKEKKMIKIIEIPDVMEIKIKSKENAEIIKRQNENLIRERFDRGREIGTPELIEYITKKIILLKY